VPGQKPVSFSPDTRRDAGRYPPVAMSDLLARTATLTVPVADSMLKLPAVQSQKSAPVVKVRPLSGAVSRPSDEPLDSGELPTELPPSEGEPRK